MRGFRTFPSLATWAVVVGVLALYLETRLWLVAKFPYFLDEGILAWYAQLGRNPDQRLISLNEGVRPGLVWLTLGVMNLHFDPLVSIRLVAVASGLITLVCGMVLARRYVSDAAAWAFVVLGLFTPLLFLYDALGLRDIVIAAVLMSGFLLEIELARKPRLPIGFLLGITFGVGLLLKDSSKVAIYLLPLSLVYFPFRSVKRLRLAAAWTGNAVAALMIAYLATLPMRLSSAYANLSSIIAVSDSVRSFADIRAHPLRYFNESWPGVRGELTTYVTYPLIVLAVIGLVVGLRRRTRFTALLGVWATLQIASAIWIAGNIQARYLVPAAPFILLLAAVGVDEILQIAATAFRTRRRAVLVVAVAGLLVLFPALVFDARASYDPPSASYSTNDRIGFITGFTSGYGVSQAVGELKVLAGGHHLTVLSNPDYAYETFELLAAIRGVDIRWIWTNDPEAQTAALLRNGGPLPPGVGRLREIWRYDRPGHGTPIEIYARP